MPLLIGTKIGSKINSSTNNFAYLKFKGRYEVIYWNVDYIYFFRRNYHLLSMIKNFIVPMIIGYFYKYPIFVLITLQIIYLSFSLYLIIYKPFERKIISILAGVNDLTIFMVLVFILCIHYITGHKTVVSAAAVKASVNIGWMIIVLLLMLFLLNLVFSVAIEWDTIKEFCNNLK